MRYRLIGSLTFLFICFLFHSSVRSQVTIKEKITLTPKTRNATLMSTTSAASGLVMPQKGLLQVYYVYASRIFSPIPDSVKLLAVIRHRDSVKTDQFLSRFQNRYTTSTLDYHCSCTCYQYDTEYRYQITQQPVNFFHVLRGDTVDISYITDNLTGGLDTVAWYSADTVTNGVGWSVTYDQFKFVDCVDVEQFQIFVGIIDTTIQFSQMATKNVYPLYPDHNTTLATKDTLDLLLRVQYGDTAMKNYWVEVDSTVLADSGGHAHLSGRPFGKFIVPRTPGSSIVDTLRTFTRQTDTSGVLRFKFLASQFGAIEKITAKRVSDTTSFDTLRLTTKVPGLTELAAGAHYVLVGAPNSSDPCRPTPTGSQHYRNHFGTTTLINAVQAIANAYDTLHPGILLRVNDMSLKFGGGFDVGNNWENDIFDQYPADPKRCNDVGHCTHRTGVTADLGHHGLDQANSCVSINLNDLKALIKKKTGNKPHVEGDHEHITVSQ